MSNVTVLIVIQGLIALSPYYDGGMANRMTALVVDSRHASPSRVCIVEHEPMIEFPALSADCTADPDNGCRWSGGKCICALDRHEIALVPDADPTPSVFSRGRPSNPLPLSNANDSAGDFSYVASLSNLGHSLDPRYLEKLPPAPLAARFTFPFESLIACDHATRPDDLKHNVHSFQFRKLGTLGQDGQLHQAIAQNLGATVSLDTSLQAPILRLSKFDGSAIYEFPLKVVDADEGLTIRIKNHRPILQLGDPCDDGIGRDFAFFYELVSNPPAWADRAVPHVKFTSWEAAEKVIPIDCDRFKMPMSRPVCPVAGF